MEDFGEEVAFGGDLGEVGAEDQLHPEYAALVRRASWHTGKKAMMSALTLSGTLPFHSRAYAFRD